MIYNIIVINSIIFNFLQLFTNSSILLQKSNFYLFIFFLNYFFLIMN